MTIDPTQFEFPKKDPPKLTNAFQKSVRDLCDPKKARIDLPLEMTILVGIAVFALGCMAFGILVASMFWLFGLLK